MYPPFFHEKTSFSRLLFIFLSLLLFQACDKGGDVRTIDFAKSLAAEPTDHRLERNRQLRVAIGAMISPKETFLYYHQFVDFVGRKLGLRGVLVQRRTYSEINELIGKGKIDMALVCSGPYASEKEKYHMELLATPQIHGAPFYQAYLIVERRSLLNSLRDLKGKTFAFTDPDSNTGRLVPLFWLRQMREEPESFFGKTIYTYSHDNSIRAVSKGLVDGASVDSLVWGYYRQQESPLVSGTRIIKESEHYGNPPLVINGGLDPELKNNLKRILFSMDRDPEGKKILRGLMIDRFLAPKEKWYEPIRQMKKMVFNLEGDTLADN